MVDFELFRVLAWGGPSAVLAGFIFMMYRMDCRTGERRYYEMLKSDQQSRKENTAALTALTVVLQAMDSRGRRYGKDE